MTKFKAAMFDVDGTITEKGIPAPSKKMAKTLVKVAKKVPIAFCTGRQLESFENYGLNTLIDEIPKRELEGFFENLFLIAENGSLGYRFNTDLDKFEEFYRVKWPSEFANRSELEEKLGREVEKYGKVHKSKGYPSHRVVIVLTTNASYFEIKKVYEYSDKIYEKVVAYLEKMDSDYEKVVHVGNAGIGVLVGPADGDKDRGIQEFGKYLKNERGVELSEDFREILVVGDRPDKGGNDFQFLNGKFGTPFTVGELGENGVAKPVKDKKGRRLMNSKGTIYLLNNAVLHPK